MASRKLSWSDGEKIIEMLERLELGVKPRKVYELDAGFFDEFET